MAIHYVPITRDQFENWLSSLTSVGSQGWSRVPGKAGLYLIHLSDLVAVLASSSIGHSDAAMDKDKGAIYLRLVSRLNYARVLNKKAIDQGKFYRTKNWQTTLTKAVRTFQQTYVSSREFYDRLAEIPDVAQYRREWLERIRSIPGSNKNTVLQKIESLLEDGKILSKKQEDQVVEIEKGGGGSITPDQDDPLLEKLKMLHSQLNWSILTSFIDQVSRGYRLSPRQLDVVDKAELEVRNRPAVSQRPARSPGPQRQIDEALVQRLEGLEGASNSQFVRDLLNLARRGVPLSDRQLKRVEEMESRSRPSGPSSTTSPRSDLLGLIDALERQEKMLQSGDGRAVEEAASRTRTAILPKIAEIGRMTEGSDREFMRHVWRSLTNHASLSPQDFQRLRQIVGLLRQARLVEIPASYAEISVGA